MEHECKYYVGRFLYHLTRAGVKYDDSTVSALNVPSYDYKKSFQKDW